MYNEIYGLGVTYIKSKYIYNTANYVHHDSIIIAFYYFILNFVSTSAAILGEQLIY